MNANQGSRDSAPLQYMIPYLLVFVSLLGMYYLYQYLFGPRIGILYTLLATTQSAKVESGQNIIVHSDKLPRLFEGGEFTVSTWIYVSNWSYRSGLMKSILRMGGRRFDTFRIYLGGRTPTLHIRFHTHEQGMPHRHHADDDLSKASLTPLFTSLSMDTGSNGNSKSAPLCDLPEIDLQRWVHLTVSVNAKTVDVYTDGKLARSCVLPTQYKVDSSGLSAKLLDYGGFGGQLSTTTMYDTALNPESVHKIYMAGPEPITSLGGWMSSIFAPGISISVTPLKTSESANA
jgi:Concanavalin A-like lectin/glucanases superfamily